MLNRVRAKAWPNTVREVILQKGQYDPFKTDNENFKKIMDPLFNAGQSRKNAWYKSYEIAQSLLAEEIKISTTATHFHGRGVDKNWFISHIVPDGKFLRQIDDSFFYWSPN